MTLTNLRHEKFCIELAKGVAPKDAAVLAGYPPRNAAETAWRLTMYPKIAGRLEELKQPAISVRESLLRELGQQVRATTICDESGRRIGVYIPLDESASRVGA